MHVVQNEQVLVGALFAEWIEAGQAELGARLPPAVRAADHSRQDGVADLRLGTNATARRFHGDPLAAFDPVLRGRLGMDLGGRVRRALAEARQTSKLAMHVLRTLGVRQHQRKTDRKSTRLNSSYL